MANYKIVLSDIHLGSGLFLDTGIQNPHEDFFFDEELCEFFDFFSAGEYGENVEVELIINGDFFDFLNIPIEGEFPDVITEDISILKLEAILRAHKKVFRSLKNFLNKNKKSVYIMIGNHDADLFFPNVQKRIYQELLGTDYAVENKLFINMVEEEYRLPGKISVRHGNQYEAMHVLDFKTPVLTNYLDEPVLNLPWGSFYVLKIANKFKWERSYADKVRPIRTSIMIGLLFDTIFTIKFMAFSIFYFMKTRFVYHPTRKAKLKVTFKILFQEFFSMFTNLENSAQEILEKEDINTLIMGHTHTPMYRPYINGKAYINAGSWTKMINLDPRNFSHTFSKTFVLIKYYESGEHEISLRNWNGVHHAHRVYAG